MMKRIVKIFLVIIMLVGIVFSIMNFTSIETKASGQMGVWAYTGGRYVCMYDGTECEIGGGVYEK